MSFHYINGNYIYKHFQWKIGRTCRQARLVPVFADNEFYGFVLSGCKKQEPQYAAPKPFWLDHRINGDFTDVQVK